MEKSKVLKRTCITPAILTSLVRTSRQGLKIDKQNCLQNSELISGTGPFNVKSNSFRVSWSLTACLDVLFNAGGSSSSRRMDTGLPTGRSVHTKETIQEHGLQRKAETKTTTDCCFPSARLPIMQQTETAAACFRDGVWLQKGHAKVLLNRFGYSSRRRSHFIFIAPVFNWVTSSCLLLSLHLVSFTLNLHRFPSWHKKVLAET